MGWKRVDDLDSSTEDVEQVTFGLDGKCYRIDLSVENRVRLLEALDPFTRAATVYGVLPDPDAAPPAPDEFPRPELVKPPRPQRKRVRRQNNTEADTIRKWARAVGMEVADNGRIPDRILTAWQAAINDGQS